MRPDNFNDRLSASQLLAISQEISEHFSPIFETTIAKSKPKTTSKLSRTELLEISEDISRKFQFPVASLAQSNTLVLLPVDPASMYAYWNFSQETANIPEKTAPIPLTLRVYSAPKQIGSVVKKSWQDMPIQAGQTRQKIPLPVLTHNSAYSVAIGEHRSDGRFITFVHSTLANTYPANTMTYHKVTPETALQAQSKNTAKNTSGSGSRHS
ncbi:DUF4912 domain-containing protein [Crenothrix sp.]|uniref:DUF4912 domain-containing protein n=1 Tax=Crenothrix sp. TaxID=3100433 RepID=UPI00374C95F7